MVQWLSASFWPRTTLSDGISDCMRATLFLCRKLLVWRVCKSTLVLCYLELLGWHYEVFLIEAFNTFSSAEAFWKSWLNIEWPSSCHVMEGMQLTVANSPWRATGIEDLACDTINKYHWINESCLFVNVCVCLYVFLGVPRAHYTPLRWYLGYLCTRKAQYAPLRRNMHHGAQGGLNSEFSLSKL